MFSLIVGESYVYYNQRRLRYDMNRKQIIFAAFIFCLFTAVYALSIVSEHGILFHEAVIMMFVAYICIVIILLFGVGCAIVYDKLGND